MSQRPDSCKSCALNASARGFCLDVGDPRVARLAICLETPAGEEVNFSVLPPTGTREVRSVLGTVCEAQTELMRRTRAFPNVPPGLRSRGVPVVGRTGALLNRLLREAGLDRDRIFLMNSLRCFPVPSKKGDTYPTGAEKSIAQSMCRQYDLIGEGEGRFSPQVIVLTMHPASLFKDGASSAEPLILADLQKAASFVKDGLKVLVLMGGHAAEVMLGFGTNVSKWRGHYEWTDSTMYNWYRRRVEKLNAKAEKARRSLMPKEKKKTKAEIARENLAESIFNAVEDTLSQLTQASGGEPLVYSIPTKNLLLAAIVAKLTPPPRAKKPKLEDAPVESVTVCPPGEVC